MAEPSPKAFVVTFDLSTAPLEGTWRFEDGGSKKDLLIAAMLAGCRGFKVAKGEIPGVSVEFQVSQERSTLDLAAENFNRFITPGQKHSTCRR